MTVVSPSLPARKAAPVVFLGAHVSAMFLEVDRVPVEGETVLGTRVSEPIDGGKATCQAVAAARLGTPAVFVSVVGSDERGSWWATFLEREGIGTRWLYRVEGRTDIGVVMLPPSRAPAIVSVTALSRQLDIKRVEGAASAIRGAAMIVCALECPASSVERAFEIARSAKVPTLLNPAPADHVPSRLIELADIIVANEPEAARLAGHPASPGGLAQELARQLAPRAVIVTAGPEGAWLGERAKDEPTHAPAPRVEAVDTTGAGDAFIGALVNRLHAGAPLVEAMTFGVQVASCSVLVEGSIASYPTALDLAERVAEGAA